MKTGGISGTRLFGVLKTSDNTHLQYPCTGLLEIQEVSVCGTIIKAVFRPLRAEGMAPFVQVKNPVFELGYHQAEAMNTLQAQPQFFD